MTTRPLEQPVDHREAALTMAIAVLVDRIRSLDRSDRDDLFDLSKALFAAETEEEVRAASLGFHEILDQAPQRIIPLATEDSLSLGTAKWAEFVGGKIHAARIEANMTQVDLANASGLPQSHISRLESGMHSPSRVTIEKIARAVNKPISFFDPSAADECDQ